MKTLHILNGDSTFDIFQKTAIKGDTLVWREILADGPVSNSNLWELRKAWMNKNFGANASEYQSMVIDEAAKIQNLASYDSVILWFEFDLTCQINLIYILKLLSENTFQNTSIFLICPSHFEGIINFRGLGMLNPNQLASLESSKVKLETADLQLAIEAWSIYVANNYHHIVEFLKRDFGNLNLLEPALEAHLSRFPSPILNTIEKILLEIIDLGICKRHEIYEQFWKTAPIYGLTDLQINTYLTQLAAKGYDVTIQD